MTNLTPGQYQIGSFVFGSDTMFTVEKIELGGYDVNAQDFQVSSSDEIRFGVDSFKPLPIQIIINAFENRVLGNVVALAGSSGSIPVSPEVGNFIQEWRDDGARTVWGATKPLYYCREDGTTVAINGRPGKLAVSNKDPNKAYRKIVAEYRCADVDWMFSDSGVFG